MTRLFKNKLDDWRKDLHFNGETAIDIVIGMFLIKKRKRDRRIGKISDGITINAKTIK